MMPNHVLGRVILRGVPVNPGRVIGTVKMVADLPAVDGEEWGDILVFTFLPTYRTPALLYAMKRASAVITDYGGRVSHIAVISGELGKPCVITKNAVSVLKNGQLITVDGTSGKIYAMKE